MESLLKERLLLPSSAAALSWLAQADDTIRHPVARSRPATSACATSTRTSEDMPDSRQFEISRPFLLLLTAGVALVVLGVSRWDPVGPQSLICRHRDDPKGLIDFRVDVGRGDDRVRFADGQTTPVQTSRDQLTFLEKESNGFHLDDNDNDNEDRALRELGLSTAPRSRGINVDLGHDVEHRTTIDRHRLTFQEQALTAGGKPGAVMMDGRCRPVATG